jgi:hypothetical protein
VLHCVLPDLGLERLIHKNGLICHHTAHTAHTTRHNDTRVRLEMACPPPRTHARTRRSELRGGGKVPVYWARMNCPNLGHRASCSV